MYSSVKKRIERMMSSFTRKYSKDDCNVIFHENSDVTDIIKKSDKKYWIVPSGYSFPQPQYEELTFKFLKELHKKLGSKKTGYITTPALCNGSIYDITTRVGGLNPKDMVFFTTEQYWKETHLDSFRSNLDMKKYTKTPIYTFPDTQTYAEATANASNTLICTGGKMVAVTEIIEALKRKSKVVLLINENLMNEGIDKSSEKVENAAKYFLDYMIFCHKDLPETNELDLNFLKKYPGRITHLVRVYFIKDEKSAKDAAERAANFIKRKTIYDYLPEKSEEIDKTPGAVAIRTDREMAMQHYMQTGQYKRLYE